MLVTAVRPTGTPTGSEPSGGCRGSGRGGNVRDMESADSLLVARLAAGDDRALAEVFDTLAPTVLAAARQVLDDASAAQDVVQEVFVDLWCHPDRFDAALGSLRTYLRVCARHRALDHVRSELRRARREERHQRMVPAQRAPSPSEEVTAAETVSVVRDAVRRLPPDQRTVIELAYFGGLSYRDVARAVGIPEGTAKSRLRRALAALETLLDRHLLESS